MIHGQFQSTSHDHGAKSVSLLRAVQELAVQPHTCWEKGCAASKGGHTDCGPVEGPREEPSRGGGAQEPNSAGNPGTTALQDSRRAGRWAGKQSGKQTGKQAGRQAGNQNTSKRFARLCVLGRLSFFLTGRNATRTQATVLPDCVCWVGCRFF